MIRVMYDVCTITELSTVLGRDKSVVSRWAKLYTVPQKGRERTIFDIVTSHKKQKTKKVVTEEQIKEAAKKCGIWTRFAKLSAAQQTCLATYGMSSPVGRPSKAQKSQLRSLAAKCGITLRVKG